MELLLTDPRKATCTKYSPFECDKKHSKSYCNLRACGDDEEDEEEDEEGILPVNIMFHIFSFLSNAGRVVILFKACNMEESYTFLYLLVEFYRHRQRCTRVTLSLESCDRV